MPLITLSLWKGRLARFISEYIRRTNALADGIALIAQIASEPVNECTSN